MIGHSEANEKKVFTPPAVFLLPLLFAFIVILSFFMLSGRVRSNEKVLCEAVAFHGALEAKDFVERFMEAGSSLRSALEWNTALTKSSIEAISEEVLRSQPFVIGVSTAPSAIVKYHFPESGNESLIGHDLLSNPERRDALTQAANLKSAVISGPFESVEGGPALFVRYPVFASGKLWGFVSLTIDFERMIQALGMDKKYPGFVFAFSEEAKDSSPPGELAAEEASATQASRLLAGGKGVFDNGVSRRFELPGATWNIHVMPSRGWSSTDPFLYALLLAGLAGALALYSALRLRAKRGGGAKRRAPDAEQSGLSSLEATIRAIRDKNLEAKRPPQVVPASPSINEKNAEISKTAEGNEHTSDKASTETEKKEGDHASDNPIDIRGKQGREVTFKGPDVKGQLYMPDVLFSGDPSLLFVRPEEKSPSGPEADKGSRQPEASSPVLPPAALPHRQELLFSLEEAPVKSKPSILVVDDSEANRDIVSRMLSLRGYKADFAASGEEALSLCATRRYAIVFMDCFMPDMDGYKTSSLLRASHADYVFSIVGMSARIGDQELERCKLSGMDDLLAKPFTLKDLMAQIEKRRE